MKDTKNAFEPPAQPYIKIISKEYFSGYIEAEISDIEGKINQINQIEPCLLRTPYSYSNR